MMLTAPSGPVPPAGPRQKTRDVDEGQKRDVECVAEPDEARPLDGRIDVEAPGENGGLVGGDPDGPAVHPRESDDDVPGVMLLDLEEVAVVHYFLDVIPDVVRLRWVCGELSV